MTFRRLFTIAAFSGLAAGLLLTLVQQFQVIPTILEAEVYEQAAATDPMVAQSSAWQPQEGLERTFFTALANIVIALGYALLLGAAVLLSGRDIDWRSGLLWGLAGYAVFFIAPSLGLPPEVPGTEAADLTLRQLWWLVTVSSTAGGLALWAFRRGYLAKAGGALLILLPHLYGAPHPAVHLSTAPEALARTFIFATAVANAVFWLALGSLFGWCWQKSPPHG